MRIVAFVGVALLVVLSFLSGGLLGRIFEAYASVLIVICLVKWRLGGQAGKNWNGKQKTAYAIGLVLFILMGFFPPLEQARWHRGTWPGFPGPANQTRQLDSHFLGYDFVFSREVQTIYEGEVFVEYNIVWAILLGQWIGVLLLLWSAIQLLRTQESESSELLIEKG